MVSATSRGVEADGAASHEQPDPMIGRTLAGRYRVDGVLGQGGVGVVYRATHVDIGRLVALKVLHPEYGAIPETKRRFEREARALSALSHPHIVSIADYGIAGGMPYLAMELIEGRTLADLLDDDGPPPIDTALDIERQILRGLAFAHARGILHRDLKPANVFLQELPDDPHHVKLLDFGLAKIVSDDESAEAEPTLTRSGTILGTPSYMAPEQASGSVVDARADVYSAGCVLFELLSGRVPFVAPTRGEVVRAHLVDPVPAPRSVRPGLEVTPALEALLDRALAKDRADRFVDAGAMLEALDALPRPAARIDAHVAAGGHGGLVPSDAITAAPGLAFDDEPTSHLTREGVPGSLHGKWRSKALVVAAAVIALGAIGAGLVVAHRSRAPRSRAARPRGATVVAAPSAATGHSVASTNAPAKPHGKTAAAGTRDGRTPVARVAAAGATVPAPAATVAAGTGAPGTPNGAAAATPAPDAPAVTPSRPPPFDPFARPLSPALRRFRRVVQSRDHLTRGDQRDLRKYDHDHPNDARPQLILAHAYTDRGWLSDALTRYEIGYRINPGARGDARMMQDLVRMVASRPVSRRAAAAVANIYGREALQEVEAALRAQHDPAGRARLKALRDQLR